MVAPADAASNLANGPVIGGVQQPSPRYLRDGHAANASAKLGKRKTPLELSARTPCGEEPAREARRVARAPHSQRSGGPPGAPWARAGTSAQYVFPANLLSCRSRQITGAITGLGPISGCKYGQAPADRISWPCHEIPRRSSNNTGSNPERDLAYRRVSGCPI